MELEPDFRIEETRLLSGLRQAGEAEPVQRILNDHEGMRALIAQDSVEKRVPLAEVLTAHTRCQEQILFERAQQFARAQSTRGVGDG
jgi:hypothetical protein